MLVFFSSSFLCLFFFFFLISYFFIIYPRFSFFIFIFHLIYDFWDPRFLFLTTL